MFSAFKGASGKAVQIDSDAILAIEDLGNGSRIHVGTGTIDVKESADEVLARLEEIDEGEEDED